MGMCPKCSAATGGLWVLVGILFLLQDWNVWGFWGVSWYSVAFLLFGLKVVCRSCCKDCHSCCHEAEAPAPKAKRR